MAELRFDCPSCKQSIACDELWGGHLIQCPSCNSEITVPQKPAQPAAAQGAPLVPTVPAAPSRLSVGRSQHQPATASPGLSAQHATVFRKPPAPKAKGKGPLVKIGIAAGVLAALGAGAYFGWPYIKDLTSKGSKKDAEAANAAAAADTNVVAAATNTPPPEKVLPIIPPVYSLAVDSAKIPEGRANGMLSGTSFVVENARIDHVGAAQVLRLSQGAAAVPDREVMIYLHLKQGESLSNYSLKINSETRGTGIPQVLKRVKKDPRYAPQPTSYTYGYAMNLEVNQLQDGNATGKIYLALPDTEQSVVAGVFKALGGTNAANPAAAAAAGATPAAAAPAASSGEKAAFDKRYGIKK